MGTLVARWLVVPLLVLSLGLLLIFNLLLQTRWCRGWLEHKLEKRSRFDWTVESLSWTPWTGIQVRDITARPCGRDRHLASRALCRADIDTRIYWSSLLRGKVALREVRFRRAELAIPLELLALLPEEEAVPQKALQPAKPAPGPEGVPGVQSDGKNGARPRVRTPVKKEVPTSRPFRVIIDRCGVVLYSSKNQGKSGLVLRGLRAELPLQGGDASGWVQCDGFDFGGYDIGSSWRSRVEWKSPVLIMPPTEFVWEGLPIRLEGSLMMMGIPRFLATVEVPDGPVKMNRVPMVPWPEASLEAGSVQMQGTLRGALTSLGSWRGNLVLKAAGLALTAAGKEERMGFEEGRLMAGMRNGIFQVLDARLHSEQLSFLGNGVLLPDGRVRGVIRVVADQDNASVITRFANGAMWTGGWTRSWLAPLDTPDRYYRDLELKGTVNGAVINTGRNGENLEVSQAWKRMMSFVRNEAREAGQGVATVLEDQPLTP